MENVHELKFESPGFKERLRGMLGVDFYRLFHTPMFYIFLGISALIPALILGTTGTTEGVEPLYTNTWNIIAANTPIYAVSDMGEYANMNMVFIFGGIMVSIFIGHDYKSGYVKQLFTTHAKKQDYMMSKSMTCAFAMACMCVTYIIGGVVAELEDRAFICGDEELLALVWTNLLSNAIKFTPSGGTVTLTQTSDDDWMTVTVVDTGCGMNTETVRHIFEQFYQGDTSHATEGNGLGLTLVRRILELSDGTITVKSAVGQGSIFTVRLPSFHDREERP